MRCATEQLAVSMSVRRSIPDMDQGRDPECHSIRVGRPADIARRLGVGRASVYRVLREEGGGIAMPIRPELRPLYPPHWRELSSHVRFERAGGRCQRCGRPHLALLRCLLDGRWFDEQAATWRDCRGRPARWPDLCGGNSVPDDARRARGGAPGQRSHQQSPEKSAGPVSAATCCCTIGRTIWSALDHLSTASVEAIDNLVIWLAEQADGRPGVSLSIR